MVLPLPLAPISSGAALAQSKLSFGQGGRKRKIPAKIERSEPRADAEVEKWYIAAVSETDSTDTRINRRGSATEGHLRPCVGNGPRGFSVAFVGICAKKCIGSRGC